MGFSIYWHRQTQYPANRFAAAVGDIETVLNATGVAIAGFDGTGNGIFEDEHIVFNGLAPQACEPFELRRVEFDRRGRQEFFGHCKTEHLPYGKAVMASLIVLTNHLRPDFWAGSDGTADVWDEPRRIVAACLGFGADFTPRRE